MKYPLSIKCELSIEQTREMLLAVPLRTLVRQYMAHIANEPMSRFIDECPSREPIDRSKVRDQLERSRMHCLWAQAATDFAAFRLVDTMDTLLHPDVVLDGVFHARQLSVQNRQFLAGVLRGTPLLVAVLAKPKSEHFHYLATLSKQVSGEIARHSELSPIPVETATAVTEMSKMISDLRTTWKDRCGNTAAFTAVENQAARLGQWLCASTIGR